MNIVIILKVIGFLLLLIGPLMLLGIPFSLYYGSDDIPSILISALITMITGSILWLTTRSNNETDIRRKESFIIVTSSWIVLAMFGSLPFIIHGSIPDYTDAFFETMSGFTTTGATILTDIEAMPQGLLFWRSLTQWLGGMGIIVLSLAILPFLGIGGMQLFFAEVPGPTKDKIHPRIKETAKRLWGIYFIFTALETLLLLVGGMNLFDAVNHALTTMATGGFSTKNQSVAHFNSPFIHYTIIVFMFLAGTNFTLHYYLLHKKFNVLRQNEEFKFYAKIILAFSIIIAAAHYFSNLAGIERSFRDSLFQVVSIVTTTGFITSDYELWGSFFILIFFFLLFVGGSAGSTGGGVKIVRHYLILKNGFAELKRLLHPRAIIHVRFNNSSVSPEILSNIFSFLIFYAGIFILGTIVMSLLGLDLQSAAGSVATSLGNVGPAIGSVGPTDNFAHIPDLGKWVLSFLMLMGRLELFTVLIIFSPSFWKS